MSHGIITAPSVIALPAPATPIAIRPAHLGDLAFIDRLQKMHSKMVGWMPTKQLEGKIAAGHVLVAEEVGSRQRAVGSSEAPPPPTAYSLPPTAIGYAIARDQYFKRDDVGIIYQLNVVPTHQRGLIGAHLLKAVFERAAYGCRLFCCWCAQDIAANRFWEAMGFVPLAFRAGSRDKDRVHIFWQKRIREGDTVTPWWFPCKTDSGAIREDRIVLPIPPGVSWWDEMPRILPQAGNPKLETRNPKQISLKSRRRSNVTNPPRYGISATKLHFGAPAAPTAVKARRVTAKSDPKLLAAARELRDRWLEEVNCGGELPNHMPKYHLTRPAALPRRPLGSTRMILAA
jgi:GNAT superfamily N-acetyltransferase